MYSWASFILLAFFILFFILCSKPSHPLQTFLRVELTPYYESELSLTKLNVETDSKNKNKKQPSDKVISDFFFGTIYLLIDIFLDSHQL